MTDPLIYPIAQDFIPYRSPIRIAGLTATPCSADEANGEALSSSHDGDTSGYERGQVVRARYLREVGS